MQGITTLMHGISSLLYEAGIRIYGFLLMIASSFHPKAALMVRGRRESLARIRALALVGEKPSLWFHFASLGEFEQGRPVLEKAREARPGHRIIVTFYSPSGYEIRKNTPLAEQVFYLPQDTPGHARLLLDRFRPEAVIFTKYEYWPFYFREIKRRGVPLYLISAIFRPEQIFFKWYGGFFRKTLSCVEHFFTQNERSLELLAKIGLHNASIAGDTRFDRVADLPVSRRDLPPIEAFIDGHFCVVAGSTWPGDELALAALLQAHPDWKMVLAPHEIHESHLHEIQKTFPHSIRFSEYSERGVPSGQHPAVLIIDNIGMLSSLYGYGNLAYIGGGFGSAGIHNTLEAAAYGIPVVFGPNYHKFEEAKGLISVGGGFSVGDTAALIRIGQTLTDEPLRLAAGLAAGSFVRENAGATGQICQRIFGPNTDQQPAVIS